MHTRTHTPPPIFMLILLVNTSRPLSPWGRSRVGCLFLSSSILPPLSSISLASLLLHTFLSIFSPLCDLLHLFSRHWRTHTHTHTRRHTNTFPVPPTPVLFLPITTSPPLSPPSRVSAACRSCCYGDRSYLHSVPLASPAPGAQRERE